MSEQLGSPHYCSIGEYRQGDNLRSFYAIKGIDLQKYCGIAIVALTVFVYAGYASAQTILTISAAASLKETLAETEATYTRSHAKIKFANNYGSSGTLLAQIDQGAPIDVFLSAASKPMDELSAKGLLASGTRLNLLRNSLVLIAPIGSTLHDFQGLTDRTVHIIALGDPASVPAGQYGRQTLSALHLIDKINAKLVLGKDVRQVLTYVETGNADAGLVYATDARISKKIRIVSIAPESSHDPIIYPVAVIKGSRNEQAARDFVQYLSSPVAQSIFLKYGFTSYRP